MIKGFEFFIESKGKTRWCLIQGEWGVIGNDLRHKFGEEDQALPQSVFKKLLKEAQRLHRKYGSTIVLADPKAKLTEYRYETLKDVKFLKVRVF